MTIETAQPTPTDHPGMVRTPPKSTVALALLSISALSFLIENQSAVSQSPSSLQIRPSDGPVSKTEFDRHAEEQKFRALRWMDENGEIPPDGLWRALEHRRQALADSGLSPALHDRSAKKHGPGPRGPKNAGIQTNSWTWLGPANFAGRVRSILIHPTLTNTLWCGAVNGGVWKSTNSGASWFPLNDFMANLGVACMVMDPINADVIYAGT